MITCRLVLRFCTTWRKGGKQRGRRKAHALSVIKQNRGMQGLQPMGGWIGVDKSKKHLRHKIPHAANAAATYTGGDLRPQGV